MADSKMTAAHTAHINDVDVLVQQMIQLLGFKNHRPEVTLDALSSLYITVLVNFGFGEQFEMRANAMRELFEHAQKSLGQRPPQSTTTH